jgi:hypothetical protein
MNETFEPENLHQISVGRNETDYECPQWNMEDFMYVQNVQHWIGATFSLPVSFIGIIINLFCLIVLLSKQKLREILFNQVWMFPFVF